MADGQLQKYADGTDSGWVELTNSTVYSGKILYRQIGKIVCVIIHQIKLLESFSSSWVALLPNGSLPVPMQTATTIAGANDFYRLGMCQINTSGALVFYRFPNNSAIGNTEYPANANIFMEMTYMVA